MRRAARWSTCSASEDPRFDADRRERDDLGGGQPSLTPRERRVLALRFVGDMTQTQIAQEIGVSQMQVSRILRRALGPAA